MLLFVAAQVGLNLAARREWLPLRDPVYSEKLDLLRDHHPGYLAQPAGEGQRPARVLALGSSRTQLGFDAGRFADRLGAEAFNFGCPAAGPLTCALYYRRLLDGGVRPDFLLLEIHPGFITPRSPAFETRWLHPHRLRPDEPAALADLGWPVPDPPQDRPAGWLTAAYSYRFAILTRVAPVLLPTPFGLIAGPRSDRCGYVRGMTISPAERPRAVERTFEQYSPVLTDYHVGGPGCAAVRDVLARSARHGVRAAVVLMPESSEFRGWYGSAGYAEITAFAAELASEYGVPVFDAREWVPDEGFTDAHHLTPAGAATYSDRLAEAVAGSRWPVASERQERKKR